MSTRICVYKDCHNFYCRVDNTICSDVTLFSFPKDPKRAELWRSLGQVHPKIGAKQLYMCSKHFDAKYLSVTKNRTILLGQAVPNAYEPESTEEDNPNESEGITTIPAAQANFYIKSSDDDNVDICTVNEKPKLVTPAGTAQSFYINLGDDQLSIDNVVMIESSPAKEKQFEVSIATSSPTRKRARITTSPPTRKRARSSTPARDSLDIRLSEEEYDEELIDPTEVNTFKVKGKNYVEMSLQYYLHEKRQMVEQLRHYKQILSNIKLQLKPLEDI